MATRLAPHLDNLVSSAQNAFIRKRYTHDNCIYTQRVIQTLHKKNKPALFVKPDISKAFDSISWSYLLDVLEALGFSKKWRDWISSLLLTSSSRVLINGKPGEKKKIKHARGLRQATHSHLCCLFQGLALYSALLNLLRNGFLQLWESIQQIPLNEEAEDTIRWRWTGDGEYTTTTAYKIQFMGVLSKLKLTPIWKAHSEPKCRFFGWTSYFIKNFDRKQPNQRGLAKRPFMQIMWDGAGDTTTPLQRLCLLKRDVEISTDQCDIPRIRNIDQNVLVYSYWRRCRPSFDQPRKKDFAGIIFYFWWNICKERIRRTYQQKSRIPVEVSCLCKDDISQYNVMMQPVVALAHPEQFLLLVVPNGLVVPLGAWQ